MLSKQDRCLDKTNALQQNKTPNQDTLLYACQKSLNFPKINLTPFINRQVS